MANYIYQNVNPLHNRTGDCVIRAISTALEQPWEKTYAEIVLQGFMMADMPSSNVVWGAYLKKKGYEKKSVSSDCPDCYTLKDFADEYPSSTYVVALPQHVVCVKGGDYYDTWDSGSEPPLYYWEMKGDNNEL